MSAFRLLSITVCNVLERIFAEADAGERFAAKDNELSHFCLNTNQLFRGKYDRYDCRIGAQPLGDKNRGMTE